VSDRGLDRYSTLAAAIAGRKVGVVEQDVERSYTDGQTIFVPPAADGRARAGIVVQAALLAIGSLDAGIMAKLTGRKTLRHRYLTLEAARAARALGYAMPRSVTELVGELYEGPVPDSPGASYDLASSRKPVPEAPDWLGTVRPITVLRAGPLPGAGAPTEKDLRKAQKPSELRELDDEEESEPSKILELFSAPTKNPFASMVQKFLGMGRVPKPGQEGGGEELDVGGTTIGEVGRHAKVAPTPSWMRLDLSGTPAVGRRYPEWDHARRSYRPEWCTVGEFDPRPPEEERPLDTGDDRRLRQELARLGLTHRRYRRQPEGDALDVTALIEYIVDVGAGVTPDDRVYETKLRTAHDLGVVVLLDATGSTAESSEGRKVFEEQRRLVARLTAALDELDDRVATYGFYSRGRDSVRFLRVKDFDGRYDHAAQRRLAALEPGGFTRLGAAIRHAAHLLTTRAGTTNMLLVLVGDGLPYDDGYEGRYAQEDSRRALKEAVTRGIACACVSVGSATEQEVIERVWGHVPYRRLGDASEFAREVRPLFRHALKEAAASRRRIDRRAGRSASTMKSS
jgi:nitric oxide reductase NorD protein